MSFQVLSHNGVHRTVGLQSLKCASYPLQSWSGHHRFCWSGARGGYRVSGAMA